MQTVSAVTGARRRTAALRLHRDDHTHALRVAATVALPGLVLLLAGRPDLLIYAVFGSFTGMYGRAVGGRARTVQQLRGAILLSAGVAVGVTLSQYGVAAPVLVAVETVFAVGASLLADRWRLTPAGPFFAILALGATALMPAALVRPEPAVALCLATAAAGILIGRIGTAHLPAAAPHAIVRRRESAVHAVRYALAVGGAGGLALAFGFANANWAMAAAAVPLAAIDTGAVTGWELRAVLTRAGHRVAGTYAGLAITAALLPLNPGPSVLAVVVMALLFPTELFMTRHYAVAIGFFTPLIMLMTQLGTPMGARELLVARGLDTLIGVAAGVAAATAVRRRPGQPFPAPGTAASSLSPGAGAGSVAGSIT
ncbi:FUSC family protein [Gordonia caeni]|uniref:FUSC family protein n=1 Tax=Gordonia caeni TaxID=1007097 RepID=A0ABP7NWU0_9ACTN